MRNLGIGTWNRPDATEQSLADGWFRSGDLGFRDADGFLTIADRVKDMFISGGENVYPAEVEQVLLELQESRRSRSLACLTTVGARSAARSSCQRPAAR
jgi:acyl-CoA synthetase (AMP-forming)/AMP-acid ligase II